MARDAHEVRQYIRVLVIFGLEMLRSADIASHRRSGGLLLLYRHFLGAFGAPWTRYPERVQDLLSRLVELYGLQEKSVGE